MQERLPAMHVLNGSEALRTFVTMAFFIAYVDTPFLVLDKPVSPLPSTRFGKVHTYITFSQKHISLLLTFLGFIWYYRLLSPIAFWLGTITMGGRARIWSLKTSCLFQFNDEKWMHRFCLLTFRGSREGSWAAGSEGNITCNGATPGPGGCIANEVHDVMAYIYSPFVIFIISIAVVITILNVIFISASATTSSYMSPLHVLIILNVTPLITITKIAKTEWSSFETFGKLFWPCVALWKLNMLSYHDEVRELS